MLLVIAFSVILLHIFDVGEIILKEQKMDCALFIGYWQYAKIK